MKILQNPPLPVHVFRSFDKQGKISLVIIQKATFAFPSLNDGQPVLLEEQPPVFTADVFEGDPGITTPFFESDLVPFKPKCDVVLKATAHAPGGKPVRKLEVGFRVGNCEKKIRVVGDRVWKKRWVLTWLRGLKASSPMPFTSIPITYGRAFGGHWEEVQEGKKKIGALECYMPNPLGRGFAKLKKNRKRLPGQLLPNLEHLKERIKKPKKAYKPCSFGPIGRSWAPRAAFAGTADDHWLEEIAPLMPPDFDERFYQCAPPDQQIEHLQGGETVELWNLHPDRPYIRFALPAHPQPMLVGYKKKPTFETQAVVDTVLIDSDAQTFSLVWRASAPMRLSILEFQTLGIGFLCPDCRDEVITGQEGVCSCQGLQMEQAGEVEAPHSRPRKKGCCGSGRKALSEELEDPLAGKVWQ